MPSSEGNKGSGPLAHWQAPVVRRFGITCSGSWSRPQGPKQAPNSTKGKTAERDRETRPPPRNSAQGRSHPAGRGPTARRTPLARIFHASHETPTGRSADILSALRVGPPKAGHWPALRPSRCEEFGLAKAHPLRTERKWFISSSSSAGFMTVCATSRRNNSANRPRIRWAAWRAAPSLRPSRAPASA